MSHNAFACLSHDGELVDKVEQLAIKEAPRRKKTKKHGKEKPIRFPHFNDRLLVDLALHENCPPEQTVFSVLSYNILCQKYCRPGTYPYLDKEQLSWTFRKRHILGELLCYRPLDIICLQEVDRYHEWFKCELEHRGFKSYFVNRTRGKVDGCATFYNAKKFDLVFKQSLEFNELALVSSTQLDKDYLTDNVGALCLLRVNKKHSANGVTDSSVSHESNKKILYLCVLNVHLFWNPAFPEIKMAQADYVVVQAQKILDTFCAEHNVDRSQIAILSSGDYNSQPSSEVYQYLTSGSSQIARVKTQYKQSIVPIKHVDLVQTLPTAPYIPVPQVQYDDSSKEMVAYSHTLSLKSVHSCIHENGNEPLFTNFTANFQGTLDYIFFEHKKVDLVNVLQLITKEQASEQTALPSRRYPSDHLPLYATFRIH